MPAIAQSEIVPPTAAISGWVIWGTFGILLGIAPLLIGSAKPSPCNASALLSAKRLAADAERAMRARDLTRAIQLADAGVAALDSGEYDYHGSPSQRIPMMDDTGQGLSVARYNHRIGNYTGEYAGKISVLRSRLDAYAFSYGCPVP